MSLFDLCDECIAKHGPFEKTETASLLKGFCHGCQTPNPITTTVIGRREVCTNVRRCRGWTPVFPPEKYAQYTEGWHTLLMGPFDKEFPEPPIWVHCPACVAEDKRTGIALAELMSIKPHKVPWDSRGGPPVSSPEDDAVFAQIPNVVVEQGPNTNGDVFPDRAQRMKDLADLSFRPAYVTSKPDPKSIMAALNAGGIFFAKGETKFFLDPPGWDANGSPTEEWP